MDSQNTGFAAVASELKNKANRLEDDNRTAVSIHSFFKWFTYTFNSRMHSVLYKASSSQSLKDNL